MKPITNKAHMQRVAQLPCSACGRHGVQVHHIRAAGLTGAGQKASDWFVLPLCPSHHAELHHKGQQTWEMTHGSQVSHVEQTLQILYG